MGKRKKIRSTEKEIVHKKKKKKRVPRTELLCHLIYFLKKSGILIDCSFTFAVGVLGVSNVGTVPPTGLLGTCVVPPPIVGAAPISTLDA